MVGILSPTGNFACKCCLNFPKWRLLANIPDEISHSTIFYRKVEYLFYIESARLNQNPYHIDIIDKTYLSTEFRYMKLSFASGYVLCFSSEFLRIGCHIIQLRSLRLS